MNILFVIDTMHDGGAARVVSLLANTLTELGHRIFIGTNLSSREVSYSLHKDVTIFNIYADNHIKQNKFSRFYSHVKLIREAINVHNVDIIVGEMENALLYSLLANIGKGLPVIGHRHTSFHILGISRFEQLVYNLADACVLLNKADYNWLGKKVNNKHVIYNPCSFAISQIPQDHRRKEITVVGSLDRWEQKGFDIILRIWKNIEFKYPDWILKVVGSGPEHRVQSIKKYADSLDVMHRVEFTGYTHDVSGILRNTSIYALPSRLEGFPMTLVEAVSQGCACIAFSLNGLIPEIYSSNAVLVIEDGNVEAFQQQLETLILNINKRESLQLNAQQEVLKYGTLNIAREWEDLFNQLLP